MTRSTPKATGCAHMCSLAGRHTSRRRRHQPGSLRCSAGTRLAIWIIATWDTAGAPIQSCASDKDGPGHPHNPTPAASPQSNSHQILDQARRQLPARYPDTPHNSERQEEHAPPARSRSGCAYRRDKQSLTMTRWIEAQPTVLQTGSSNSGIYRLTCDYSVNCSFGDLACPPYVRAPWHPAA